MKIIRQVPLEPALNAAHAAFDATGADDFRDWAEDRELFDLTQISTSDARRYVEEAPKTAMGLAWVGALQHATNLTVHDVLRDYDCAKFDDAEKTTIVAIHALTDEIESASALLKPVAAAVRLQTWDAEWTLGELSENRGRIDRRRIVVTTWSMGLGVDDEIPWDHIEPIMPGLRGRVLNLVTDLYAHLPAYTPETVRGLTRMRKP